MAEEGKAVKKMRRQAAIILLLVFIMTPNVSYSKEYTRQTSNARLDMLFDSIVRIMPSGIRNQICIPSSNTFVFEKMGETKIISQIKFKRDIDKCSKELKQYSKKLLESLLSHSFEKLNDLIADIASKAISVKAFIFLGERCIKKQAKECQVELENRCNDFKNKNFDDLIKAIACDLAKEDISRDLIKRIAYNKLPILTNFKKTKQVLKKGVCLSLKEKINSKSEDKIARLCLSYNNKKYPGKIWLGDNHDIDHASIELIIHHELSKIQIKHKDKTLMRSLEYKLDLLKASELRNIDKDVVINYDWPVACGMDATKKCLRIKAVDSYGFNEFTYEASNQKISESIKGVPESIEYISKIIGVSDAWDKYSSMLPRYPDLNSTYIMINALPDLKGECGKLIAETKKKIQGSDPSANFISIANFITKAQTLCSNSDKINLAQIEARLSSSTFEFGRAWAEAVQNVFNRPLLSFFYPIALNIDQTNTDSKIQFLLGSLAWITRVHTSEIKDHLSGNLIDFFEEFSLTPINYANLIQWVKAKLKIYSHEVINEIVSEHRRIYSINQSESLFRLVHDLIDIVFATSSELGVLKSRILTEMNSVQFNKNEQSDAGFLPFVWKNQSKKSRSPKLDWTIIQDDRNTLQYEKKGWIKKDFNKAGKALTISDGKALSGKIYLSIDLYEWIANALPDNEYDEQVPKKKDIMDVLSLRFRLFNEIDLTNVITKSPRCWLYSRGCSLYDSISIGVNLETLGLYSFDHESIADGAAVDLNDLIVLNVQLLEKDWFTLDTGVFTTGALRGLGITPAQLIKDQNTAENRVAQFRFGWGGYIGLSETVKLGLLHVYYDKVYKGNNNRTSTALFFSYQILDLFGTKE